MQNFRSDFKNNFSHNKYKYSGNVSDSDYRSQDKGEFKKEVPDKYEESNRNYNSLTYFDDKRDYENVRYKNNSGKYDLDGRIGETMAETCSTNYNSSKHTVRPSAFLGSCRFDSHLRNIEKSGKYNPTIHERSHFAHEKSPVKYDMIMNRCNSREKDTYRYNYERIDLGEEYSRNPSNLVESDTTLPINRNSRFRSVEKETVGVNSNTSCKITPVEHNFFPRERRNFTHEKSPIGHNSISDHSKELNVNSREDVMKKSNHERAFGEDFLKDSRYYLSYTNRDSMANNYAKKYSSSGPVKNVIRSTRDDETIREIFSGNNSSSEIYLPLHENSRFDSAEITFGENSDISVKRGPVSHNSFFKKRNSFARERSLSVNAREDVTNKGNNERAFGGRFLKDGRHSVFRERSPLTRGRSPFNRERNRIINNRRDPKVTSLERVTYNDNDERIPFREEFRKGSSHSKYPRNSLSRTNTSSYLREGIVSDNRRRDAYEYPTSKSHEDRRNQFKSYKNKLYDQYMNEINIIYGKDFESDINRRDSLRTRASRDFYVPPSRDNSDVNMDDHANYQGMFERSMPPRDDDLYMDEQVSTHSVDADETGGSQTCSTDHQQSESDSNVVLKGTKRKAVIVPEQFPKVVLSKADAEVLESILIEYITTAANEGNPPQFLDTVFDRGALIITCRNDESKKWIKDIVHKLVGPKGCKVKVVDYLELPNPTCVKAIMWVTDKEAEKNPINVFKALASQNPGLNTRHWRLMGVSKEAGDYGVILLISKSDVKVLQKLGMRPTLRSGRVKFKILRKRC